jgi:hypothetical protein
MRIEYFIERGDVLKAWGLFRLDDPPGERTYLGFATDAELKAIGADRLTGDEFLAAIFRIVVGKDIAARRGEKLPRFAGMVDEYDKFTSMMEEHAMPGPVEKDPRRVGEESPLDASWFAAARALREEKLKAADRTLSPSAWVEKWGGKPLTWVPPHPGPYIHRREYDSVRSALRDTYEYSDGALVIEKFSNGRPATSTWSPSGKPWIDPLMQAKAVQEATDIHAVGPRRFWSDFPRTLSLGVGGYPILSERRIKPRSWLRRNAGSLLGAGIGAVGSHWAQQHYHLVERIVPAITHWLSGISVDSQQTFAMLSGSAAILTGVLLFVLGERRANADAAAMAGFAEALRTSVTIHACAALAAENDAASSTGASNERARTEI